MGLMHQGASSNLKLEGLNHHHGSFHPAGCLKDGSKGDPDRDSRIGIDSSSRVRPYK
jgi:hypothetical protein